MRLEAIRLRVEDWKEAEWAWIEMGEGSSCEPITAPEDCYPTTGGDSEHSVVLDDTKSEKRALER